MTQPVPPLPPPPEFPEKPKTSWWTLALAGFALFLLLAGLTALTQGLFGPIILIPTLGFGLICVQYLVWGWYFERIYRQGRKLDDRE